MQDSPASTADLFVPTKQPFRDQLTSPDGFAIVAELVPWAGPLADAHGQRERGMGRELAANPRISALSITDNAGGHPRLAPQTLAAEYAAAGQEVIVHVACRDRSRLSLQSLGWELLSQGLRNVLVLSGDYPVEGYGGLSRPVFDVDSVSLMALYDQMRNEAGAAGAEGLLQPALFLGCAMNNHKLLESEVMPQYLKLELKIASGADFIISQVGYDTKKVDELRRYLRLRGHDIPAVANIYILSGTVARIFNSGKIPGCVVPDALLAVAQKAAASPDKGKAFFLEFAAKQVAIARGLGYRGAYISGHRKAADIERILDLVDSFAPDDWWTFAREIGFSRPGEFFYLEPDRANGLSSDQVNRRYQASLSSRARSSARWRGSIAYRFNRLVHDLAFEPGTQGFRTGTAFYRAVEKYHLARPAHVLEHAVKVPLFDCRDCGDCSLPDIAYLCPESQCWKNQRNGPCGGTRDGLCEVVEKECIWSRAYKRLKPYGEELAMLDRPAVLQDNALRRTSAWANTYLGRDHAARRHDVAPAARRHDVPPASAEQGGKKA
jgi:methylenetetrahydrofolate reductase (NADPH)